MSAKTPKAKRKSAAGRSLKLSRRLIERICRKIEECNTQRTAAESCGISQATFYRWIEEADKGNVLAQEFKEKLQLARAKAELNLVAAIKKHGAKDWKALRFILACRNPEAWTERQNVQAEVSGPDGEPLQGNAPIVFMFPAKDGAQPDGPAK